MQKSTTPQFSKTATDFRGRKIVDAGAKLVGYAALIQGFELDVLLPEKLSLISAHHRKQEQPEWFLFTPRHMPEDCVSGQLTFALRYEGVYLDILYALFAKIDAGEIEAWVKREPTSKYSRRIWFFYEWLMDSRLNLPDAKGGTFVKALNPDHYFTISGVMSRRHHVRNNLPGVRDFCPLVRKTKRLEDLVAGDWLQRAQSAVGVVHPDVLSRAAAFLLLQDSKASFAIEGETPGKNRAERWGHAIGQAGLHSLTIAELLRLQNIVIGDHRFVIMGLRTEGGFIGVHDRSDGSPIPDHISARWQDVERLMQGMLDAVEVMRNDATLDPVISAAIIAFGFVFIHPFIDGNGRIHRYLIHHVLADKGFAPKGIVFPVSAVILEQLSDYRRILESYSKPRIEHVKWKSTPQGNVEVLNETINLYRYFDATKQAEFLYDCVVQTIERILPQEIQFLEKYDQMRLAITGRFEMPDRTIDLLIRFLRQNHGILSKRAREQEFAALSQEEIPWLEELYMDIFG